MASLGFHPCVDFTLWCSQPKSYQYPAHPDTRHRPGFLPDGESPKTSAVLPLTPPDHSVTILNLQAVPPVLRPAPLGAGNGLDLVAAP
jgi:hypothetical protein